MKKFGRSPLGKPNNSEESGMGKFLSGCYYTWLWILESSWNRVGSDSFTNITAYMSRKSDVWTSDWTKSASKQQAVNIAAALSIFFFSCFVFCTRINIVEW